MGGRDLYYRLCVDWLKLGAVVCIEKIKHFFIHHVLIKNVCSKLETESSWSCSCFSVWLGIVVNYNKNEEIIQSFFYIFKKLGFFHPFYFGMSKENMRSFWKMSSRFLVCLLLVSVRILAISAVTNSGDRKSFFSP